MGRPTRGGSFLDLMTPAAAAAALRRFVPVGRPATLPLHEAAGRVLVAAIVAPDDQPHFRRAAMDGYAVRAEDTFGAGEGAPAYLRLAGRVEMGRPPERAVAPGEAF